jgi:hypothetical protein
LQRQKPTLLSGLQAWTNDLGNKYKLEGIARLSFDTISSKGTPAMTTEPLGRQKSIRKMGRRSFGYISAQNTGDSAGSDTKGQLLFVN